MIDENILDKINSVDDIKKLDVLQLEKLASEIRTFLVENVARTGGHLASNLGVVELTLALHKVLNLPDDKIVWDVGHQSYVHKLLTGRKDNFTNLRQLGGMSGFPKRSESEYDAFDTGHSSTSISAALGIARARDINKQKFNVCAVIGDGAMTGGMAFEALNDAAHTNTKMMIILNDNEMSIAKNVGGLSQYLSNLRITSGYRKIASKTERFLRKLPAGTSVVRVVKKIKNLVKSIFLQDSFFEQLGLKYYGPIYGHDIEKLIDVIEQIKLIDSPVLLHIVTKKGKGYKPAEERPGDFHGISAFDVETGMPLAKSHITYSKIFGNKLVDIAQKNQNVVAITAAMQSGTGLDAFANKFKNRFFDVGIAEQHAVTFAAGLATEGFVPVVAIYSTFMQRAYDQILHDVALQKLHVVFALDRAGVVGEDGETHQGVYDLSFLSTIPNLIILAPSDYQEFENMLDYAINNVDGPVAIRYPRGIGKSQLYEHIEIDFAKCEKIADGEHFTLVATGKMVEVAKEVENILAIENITTDVINVRSLKPLDYSMIIDSVNKTHAIAILEDNVICGGLCSNVSQHLSNITDTVKVDKVMQFAYPDCPITHGKVDKIMDKYGLSAKCVANEILEYLGDNNAKG